MTIEPTRGTLVDVPGKTLAPPVEVAKVTPLFRLVFFSVLGLTIACLVASVWITVAVKNPNDQAKQLLDNLATIEKLGFGGILGLLGGKSSAL
ncbi:hypothetical protein GCM10009760_18640 [Kitasatospora kazusensis]|uniref:Uncharacterized protein n=1 Tax=Kitasatospora kazusensis TaxID=407974 RepID=A0ABP5KV33_9ACTN